MIYINVIIVHVDCSGKRCQARFIWDPNVFHSNGNLRFAVSQEVHNIGAMAGSMEDKYNVEKCIGRYLVTPPPETRTYSKL